MDELALFAGVGGGILGSLLSGHRVVCAVEIEPYCREVLLRRQEDKTLPPFPIWDDIRTFDGKAWCGKVDIISAGFPCQPFSVAGRQKGKDDERNMWPDTIRIIREVQPKCCLLENVPGLLNFAYIRQVFGDLAESGFNCEWDCISAASQGAPHIRDRLWIVANAKIDRYGNRRESKNFSETNERQDKQMQSIVGSPSSDVSNAISGGLQNGIKETMGKPEKNPSSKRQSRWPVEPDVGRVANGVAFRVDRLRAIGNGQVPAVVRAAWKTLKCK